ncbi:MAG TPA: PsbP-related protein [Candidatus Acidoferrales bacterium]|nr:PsbP-related protein [Candidatus Acidoferrales bacterium]
MKKLSLLTSLMVLLAASSGRKPNQSNNQKPGPAPTPSTQTYSNAKYGFTFEYPTSMQFVTPTYGNLEDQVVQVEIPKSAYPGTNFGDAAISVSVQHAKALDDCLALSPPEGSDGFKTKTTINGVNFYMTNSNGAGAGNFYDSKVYRTLKSTGGVCIEISETIHTSNIDNYTPGTVTQVSQSDVQAKLDPVVQSFKFKR